MTAENPLVAVVTGGAGGIGAATAREFYRRGMRVAVVDLRMDASVATAESIDKKGDFVRGFAADVSDSESVDRMIAEVVQCFGGIDILVNNAGIIDPGRSEDVDDNSWDRLISIHLGGTFKCSRAAFPHLVRSTSAAIISIASIAGLQGFSQRASYCAAKAGIIGLTRCLAVEWASRGIRVNAVAPGHTRTPMLNAAIDAGVLPDERVAARIGRIPMGRMGTPEEIAMSIAFLASPEASYITGQTLSVDGGFTSNADEIPMDQ